MGMERLRAKNVGRVTAVISSDNVAELPLERLRRLVDTQFWPHLTRRMDSQTIESIVKDSKVSGDAIVYVPFGSKQKDYYTQISRKMPSLKLQVVELPQNISPGYVKSINDKPGILALAVDSRGDPLPYIVPGGRFNELYGWDSYFELLGLLESGDQYLHIAESMCFHFCFQIDNYGKILNANRSYYLSRSQPPFLTDMGLKVFNKTHDKSFLSTVYTAAVKEYTTVWMNHPRLDRVTGLSRYRPAGLGVPPEVEPGHFDAVLRPYSHKHHVSIPEFIQLYNDGKVHEKDLDEYFLHDRAIRESGHDTSYRLEGVCADLVTVDLNSLLYKYELQLDEMEGVLGLKKTGYDKAAGNRRQAIDEYLWNNQDSCYYDYNCVTKQQVKYQSATGIWPLWCQVASKTQAKGVVKSLAFLVQAGGLSSCSKKSLDDFSNGGVPRQWDYPNGWAPHQILAWEGLSNYGYKTLAEKLAYKWCKMMVHSFRNFSGIVVEKYNVVDKARPHEVTAEYGNQGSSQDGFGWVNASFVIGLGYLTEEDKKRIDWDVDFDDLRDSKL